MAQTTKLVRIKPLNKHNTTKDYTVLAGKYPATKTYREAEGWYEVSTRIADLLEEELVDGRPVFQVVTKQQGILLDRQAELATQRAEQRKATAANPHGQRRSAASFSEPERPSEYFAADGDSNQFSKPKAPASKPVNSARTPEPVEDSGDTDMLEGWLDSNDAEAETPHPADPLGDENPGDAGSDATPATPAPAPAPEPEAQPRRGRAGRAPGK